MTKESTNIATALVAVVVVSLVILMIWQNSSPNGTPSMLEGFTTEGRDRAVAREMQRIHAQVASDVIQQYEIAKRQGDPIQICVQAGLVSAAFLQAKNEPQFRQWRAVEAAACNR